MKKYDNKIPSSLADLIGVTDQEMSEKCFQKFVVNCNIAEMSKLTSDSIFQYFGKSNSAYPLCSNDTIEIEEKPVFVVCLKLMLTDDSIDDQTTKFLVHIITKSDDTDPFVLWKILPSCDDYKDWLSNVEQETFNMFCTKLEALKHARHKMKLVVELKRTDKNQFFFNVVDSFFLP